MNGVLSCNAANCIHNMNGFCSAKNIAVKGFSAQNSADTLCSTFAEKTFKNAFSTFTNTNLSGEMKQLFSMENMNMYPSVQCNATRCIHNRDMLCEARSLTIAGSHATNSEGTYCSTFRG